MPLLTSLSADTLILAFIATVALREVLVSVLPASVVGPDGWLLHIESSDDT